MKPDPALSFVALVAVARWTLELAPNGGLFCWRGCLAGVLRPVPEPEGGRFALVPDRTFSRVGLSGAGASAEGAAWNSRREEA